MPDNNPFRIVIVANKTWECEPLVSVLLSRDARPSALEGFIRGYDPAETPAPGGEPPLPPEAEGLPVRGRLPIRPRLTFTVSNAAAQVEVWCVEDWMRKQRWKIVGDNKEKVSASSSSSREKFCFALPRIREQCFSGKKPDLVIAFGTAGIPAAETLNGCVTIGTRIYIHNPWRGKKKADVEQQIERFGPLLRDEIKDYLEEKIDMPFLRPTLFAQDLTADVRHAAEARFLRPPVHAADPLRILAGHGYASLGTINICDYDDYVWADEETLARFEKEVRQREIGSMETTHGLIRLTWPTSAFVFFSGLTDRVPMFNAEVTPRKYTQNFAPAHNAAVALSHLIPDFVRLHQAGQLLLP